jgi:hypothetical protein
MRLALRAANIAASVALCGCAFSPPLPNDTVFEPKITRAVLSELYCAVKFLRQQKPLEPDVPLEPYLATSELYRANFFPYDEYWVGAVDLQLKTGFQASASPELTLLGPINSANRLLTGRTPGSYNLAAGGTYDSTATTQRDDKFYVDINLLMQHWAPPTWEEARSNEAAPPKQKQYILAEPVDCERPNEGTYLEGTLGIKPWLRRAVQAAQFARFIAPDATYAGATPANLHPTIQSVWPATPAPWTIPIAVMRDPVGHTPTQPSVAKGNIPTLAATFTFIIKGSAHLGPSFTLDRVKGGSSTLLSSMRTETNDVAITLTPSRSTTTVREKVAAAPAPAPAPAPGAGAERVAPPPRTPFVRGPVRVTRYVQTDASLADALYRLDQALLKMQINALAR